MLIVEDGSGIINANSYNTLVEANFYMLTMGYDKWPSTTPEAPEITAKKEAMLCRGALYLDSYYGYRSNGRRKNPDQGLVFPQVGATYWDGRPISPDVIPTCYKQAQLVLAYLAFIGFELAPMIGAGEAQRALIRKKIDVLEWQYSEGVMNVYAVLGWVELLLAELFGPPVSKDEMQIGRVARA